MAEEPVGCAKQTRTVVGQAPEAQKADYRKEEKGGKAMVVARAGTKATDFQAPAYHRGKFTNVKLSDYSGKWVLLCFYPGDFTFV